jgi:alcohol dehydrogenase, propanol-preferring
MRGMMRAMVLDAAGEPLRASEIPIPTPGPGEVLIEIRVCAVCRTDLHILDGELSDPRLPLVPGHQIVGRVVARGDGAERLRVGERVGVSWLGWTCGRCEHCAAGRENLCDAARFTGYHIDGGFAEYAVADERFCLRIPDPFCDQEAAPLLCGGTIGYRALLAAGEARRLGFYGFGSAAHMITQVAVHQGRRVFAFTRAGDAHAQEFARLLGAEWAGGSDRQAPQELDAAIIFAPAGELVPTALRAVRKGGTVVCAGIHMTDIPSLPYSILGGERCLRSVANLTRRDGDEFLAIAARAGLRTTVQSFALEEANLALAALRAGELVGTAVLDVAPERSGAA